jgi:hypothetical protein
MMTITNTKGPVSGEPMVTVTCTCGWDLSAYTNMNEAGVRTWLAARAESHVCEVEPGVESSEEAP